MAADSSNKVGPSTLWKTLKGITYRFVKPVLLKLAEALLLVVGVGVAIIVVLLPAVTTVAAAPRAETTTVLLVPFAVGVL